MADRPVRAAKEEPRPWDVYHTYRQAGRRPTCTNCGRNVLPTTAGWAHAYKTSTDFAIEAHLPCPAAHAEPLA